MKKKSAAFFIIFAALFISLCPLKVLATNASHPSPLPNRLPPPPTGLGNPEMHRAWHLKAIGALNVWNISKGDPKTTVAVVDSGVDYNWPGIAPNIKWKEIEWPFNGKDNDGNGFINDAIGWDFVKNSNLPYDRSGHGTFMAGIIAGVEGNGFGSPGVCPLCTILPVRFLNYEGLGDTEDAVKALYYAINENVKVINFSFSGVGFDQSLYDAIVAAGKKDILIVAAASNDHLNDDFQSIYPAKFDLPNLITIAATTADGKLWSGSNWGKRTVHMAAPGDNIVGPWLGKYDIGSGTSDASAVFSGAAGLLRSIAPHISAVDVKKIFMATGRKSPALKNKLISEGILDLEAAVACAQNNLSCLSDEDQK